MSVMARLFRAVSFSAVKNALARASAAINVNSQLISGVATPVSDTDAANKSYVDGVAAGLTYKAPVRICTVSGEVPAYTRAGNVLTANANGALGAMDGVSLSVGDRLLYRTGAVGADRGIYTVTSLGDAGTPWVWTRATDADTSAEVVAGIYVAVTEGTANADTMWCLTTNNPITLNTTSLTFTQLPWPGSTAAGAGLTLTGTTLAVVAGSSGALTVSADDIDTSAAFMREVIRSTTITIGAEAANVIRVTIPIVAYGGASVFNPAIVRWWLVDVNNATEAVSATPPDGGVAYITGRQHDVGTAALKETAQTDATGTLVLDFTHAAGARTWYLVVQAGAKCSISGAITFAA